MTLFSILTHASIRKVFFSLLLGVLAGVTYALLIPLVINSFASNSGFEVASQVKHTFLTLEVSNYKFAALYLAACLVIFCCRTISQVLLTWVVIDATSKLRKRYYFGIMKAPLAKLEEVGSPRLLASITTDVQRIVNGVQVIPDVLISAATVIGMLLFLLYLDTSIFIFVCTAILFGAVTFQLPVLLGKNFFKRARQHVDTLHTAIEDSIEGAKELKLCSTKRRSFLDDVLLRAEESVRSSSKKGATIIRAAMNYGDMVSFFVIGYVTYIFVNYNAVDAADIIGAVMVLLYITGPMAVLLNITPEIVQANISLNKVDRLFRDLPQEDIAQEIRPLPQWSKVRFANLSYRYQPQAGEGAAAASTEAFAVGPVDFELGRGEITFIVGGNGSGKSTLAKLITAHYLPQGGAVHLDGVRIDRELVSSYRDRVCAIYSDYHLFEQLLGSSSGKSREVIAQYLRLLKLDHKVGIEDGRFSTLSLSDGQRKRLALLVCFLEDKDIYLFDEWAADQDPLFKEIFYGRILTDLKRENKVVVVISHDDRYFHVADQVLVMEQGRLLQAAPGRPARDTKQVVAAGTY